MESNYSPPDDVAPQAGHDPPSQEMSAPYPPSEEMISPYPPPEVMSVPYSPMTIMNSPQSSYGPPAGVAQPLIMYPRYPPTNVTPTAVKTIGPTPLDVECPSCHRPITTRVAVETATKTHLLAAIACLVGCCCIPYFIDECKNKNHYCPCCGAYIGSYSNYNY